MAAGEASCILCVSPLQGRAASVFNHRGMSFAAVKTAAMCRQRRPRLGVIRKTSRISRISIRRWMWPPMKAVDADLCAEARLDVAGLCRNRHRENLRQRKWLELGSGAG